MSIRVWPANVAAYAPQRALRASLATSPYAYHSSHTHMIRVSTLPYAYQQRLFYVQTFIFNNHTRMKSLHTHITSQACVSPRIWLVSRPSFPLHSTSYAYGFTSYAYDQRPENPARTVMEILQLLPLFNLQQSQINNYTKYSPFINSIHFHSLNP